ncbi:MAG: class II aldolase/adducin family protein [Chloroflexota bacterium]|nr:MAG: class II aldolase/adducin family protein [Chloroflexota bacterium]
MDLAEARKQLQAAGRYLLENELTWGNAGNLSARVNETGCLVTASGTHLGELCDDDLVECSLAAGASPAPSRKPSKELPMHRAIYAVRPEINAVLHASPIFSTLAACSNLAIPSNWFVEDMYYLERVERVPYCHPGSEALASAVLEKAPYANILLLENHGVLVYDTSVKEALMGLHTLELACRMAITARSGGIEMQPVSPDMVRDFLENSGYRPLRRWPARSS